MMPHGLRTARRTQTFPCLESRSGQLRTTLENMSYVPGPGYPSTPAGESEPPPARLALVRARFAGSQSLVEPLIIIVIGLALGLVDQTSSEVSGMLRVPALIAALLLVGQGLNLLEDARNARVAEQILEERERERVHAGADDGSAPAAPRQVVVPGTGDEVAEPAQTPTRAYLVLILAIWLGLATLANPTAPLSLILLSLLSAYLLFAKGWRTMQTTSSAE